MYLLHEVPSHAERIPLITQTLLGVTPGGIRGATVIASLDVPLLNSALCSFHFTPQLVQHPSQLLVENSDAFVADQLAYAQQRRLCAIMSKVEEVDLVGSEGVLPDVKAELWWDGEEVSASCWRCGGGGDGGSGVMFRHRRSGQKVGLAKRWEAYRETKLQDWRHA